MVERIFDKYIIDAGQTPPPEKHPQEKTPGTQMFYIHDRIIKGAFMFCGTWLTGVPELTPEMIQQHYHDEDEYIGFIGSNFEKPFELGAEIEFWYEDEKYIIKKSCVLFVPKKLRHAPMIYRKVDSPFFIFSTIPDPMHNLHEINDPEWVKNHINLTV
ncbi:hypothetical protein JXI42_08765 [bacterium]|nr:hypothetical protein [bacterium]